MEIIFTAAFMINLLSAGIRLAAPLLMAGLGEIITERSGILNIGIEGIMLMGALFAVFGADISGNAWAGAGASILAGAFFGLIFGAITISLSGDQVVTGAAINILAVGLSTFMFRQAYGLEGATREVTGFPPLHIPFLSEIPFIGPILFQHSLLVYLAFLLVPVTSFMIFRTMWGLSLRSVGDHPRASDTMGINVVRIRYLAVIVGGMFAGLAGAILSLSHLNIFIENISAGRGFIALAAVIFGQWNPVGTMFSALLFGIADAFQLRLQAISNFLPYQLVGILPYLLTVLALIGVVGRASPPKSLTIPYLREGQDS
jgi:general nucleoside transport system permease protein